MAGMRKRDFCDLLGHLTSSLICGLAPVLVTELHKLVACLCLLIRAFV